MRKFVALGALAAMAMGASATAAAQSASGFSYNLLEGAIISGDDYDGFGVNGSFSISPEFHVLGSIDSVEFDGGADASILSAGIGYNRAINNALDVVASASLKRAKVDGADDDIGWGLGVGLRGRVLRQLELHGGLEYVDIYNDSDTALRFGGRWYFTPNFAAGADLTDDDGGSTLRFVARYDFGRR